MNGRQCHDRKSQTLDYLFFLLSSDGSVQMLMWFINSSKTNSCISEALWIFHAFLSRNISLIKFQGLYENCVRFAFFYTNECWNQRVTQKWASQCWGGWLYVVKAENMLSQQKSGQAIRRLMKRGHSMESLTYYVFHFLGL